MSTLATLADPRSFSYLKPPRLGVPLLQAIRRDPLGVAQELRRTHGDIVGMTILFHRIYYVFRPDAARQVLVEYHDSFVKEERQLRIMQSVQGSNVLTTEGAVWERQRRILMPQFMPKKIAGYMRLMTTATEDRIETELPTEGGQSRLVDLERFTTRLTMDVILRTLFTHKASQEESDAISDSIRALSRQSMRELFWLFAPPNWLPFPGRSSKLKHRATLRGFVKGQILARRANAKVLGEGAGPPRDLLGMLLAARDDDRPGASEPASLNDQEIHDNCLVIFLAGHDTSATALTWWLGLMAAHRHVADMVREELQVAGDTLPQTAEALGRLVLLNSTLKEALRLYPPATGTFSRIALKDVRVGEVQVPSGSIIVIPIWNIQHDERWFAEPDDFKPERFMPGAPDIPRGAFMPFGAGPHFCLGQHFATVEMALIAATLVRQYDMSLEPGVSLPNPVVDLTLKPQPRMFIRFTRR